MELYQMTNSIQLFIGVSGLTLAAFYMYWTRLRVIVLRQQLFAIRNDLWDKARELDALDDPAHKEEREKFNKMIRNAHELSLPNLLYTIIAFKDDEEESNIVSDNPELMKAIEVASDRAVRCIIRYIVLYRPISGGLVTALVGVTLSVHGSIARWFRGNGPTKLESALCS